PTHIEETSPEEVICQAEKGPIERWPELRTLALYRDNGTKVCYSRRPVPMCLGDSRPRNETRKVVEFVCLNQSDPITNSPSPPAACLPVQYYNSYKLEEYA